MHEMAVAESLLRIILETAEGNGGGIVREARLAVGELSCVNVECLAFGFEALARGTAAETCRLEVRRVPIAVWCATCGEEKELEGGEALVLACPDCGARDVELRRGRELHLETISVD